MNKDLLNRQEFVDRVIRVIELQSEQKKTSCFAINGKWGVGKSFVLEMLEEQLEKIQSKQTSTDKYMIFHYNCWQYDYYEEPLVAIVASMLDTIDEKERLISDDTKKKIFEKVKGLLKIVGSALLIKASDEIEEKTGINIKDLTEFISNSEDISKQKPEDTNAFDSNFLFKKTLIKLQQTIRMLSKDKTIVFVVDELDRCLPEYAIKVLERLHHVFDSIDNVQVILSIDKSQLEHIIKKTFGENTETQKYLSKFIDFEVNLDEGSFSDKEEFDNKFAFYLQNFEYLSKYTKPEQVDEFKAKIFGGIDIRLCIEIIEKCNLLHRLLNADGQNSDFSTMCVEVLYTINRVLGLEIINPKQTFSINAMNRKKVMPAGIAFLYDVYQEAAKQENAYFVSYGKSAIYLRDIYGFILACVRLNENDNYPYYQGGYTMQEIKEAKTYTMKYNELLNIIN
ncbi:MAG: hypothetical protein IJA80_03530 [Clostridia bacterium]|nr:hypothetical protein [Clostridia bacterium]